MHRNPRRFLLAGLCITLAAAGCGSDGAGEPGVTPTRWSGPVRIDTGSAKALNPDVALGRDGNAVAVWWQFQGRFLEDRSVWSSRQGPGSGWEAPVSLGAGHFPRVACDAQGNFIAVWGYEAPPLGGPSDVKASRYQASSGWAAPTTISRNASGAVYSSVAVDAAGNAFAIWDWDPEPDMFVSRYTAGTGWSQRTVLDTARDAIDGRVAFDGSGSAIAVWAEAGGRIASRRYLAGQGWTAPTTISRQGQTVAAPEIAVNAAGNAAVVWAVRNESFSSPGFDVWANVYTAGAGWGTAQLIGDGNGGATPPKIALDPSGNAVALWAQRDAIVFNTYRPGAGWGTMSRAQADSATAYLGNVGVDGQGNFTGVWVQNNGTAPGILAARYRAGSVWTEHTFVSASDAGISVGAGLAHPAIAVEPGGPAVLVWSQTAGEHSTIWASRSD
jgi:hypothetical protein